MAAKRKTKKKTRRNPVATAVILKKGGAHQTSKSGQRGKQKRDLKKSLDEE